MEIKPEDYEQLGKFYLGRGYDQAAKAPTDELILYPSKNLVTHGVVLGMTGSGKTGLCLALIEEALMDGVPAIIIDPKGDIGNLLLTFPDLAPADFRPWINEDDAVRKNRTPDEFAADQAELWKKGLGEWGQSADRIRRLRDKVDMRIYTPGSSTGLPLSILSSLNVPNEKVLEDRELLHDHVSNTVSSIMGLIGKKFDPDSSHEHTFLCAIILQLWEKKQNVDLHTLISLIMRPPLSKVGVMNVDDFLPQNERDDLAAALNNTIASPGFSAWLEGQPLDINGLYYTPEGKPSVSILLISHLSDQERMFLVTLVLNEMIAWMRAQSGTTSLRAIFYMDEIFGYLPPVANPPSKRPMLLLLKQARAFGLGLLLATQNPVDLDYKALSNIGTWWLGRLQTERDKARVLDGLESASGAQNKGFRRAEIDDMLSGLGNRVFLQQDVNAGGPVLMLVRWAMSYLRGPISRDQVKLLMDGVRDREEHRFSTKAAGGTMMAVARPVVPAGVEEVFLPARGNPASLRYEPHLLRVGSFTIVSAKTDVRLQRSLVLLTPYLRKSGDPDWSATAPLEVDLKDLIDEPEDGIAFAEVPKSVDKGAMREAKIDFTNEIYTEHAVTVFFSPEYKEFSKADELQADFRIRLQPLLQEKKQKYIDKINQEYQGWEEKWLARMQKAEAVQKQARMRFIKKLFTPLVLLVQLLIPFLRQSKKAPSMSSVSKMGTVARAAGAAFEVDQRTGAAITPKQLNEEKTRRQQEMQNELAELDKKLNIESIKIEEERLSPYKKDIEVRRVALAWAPL